MFKWYGGIKSKKKKNNSLKNKSSAKSEMLFYNLRTQQKEKLNKFKVQVLKNGSKRAYGTNKYGDKLSRIISEDVYWHYYDLKKR